MAVASKAFGDTFEPDSTRDQSLQIIDALKRDYPQLMQALNAQVTPQAQAELAAAKAVTPGYNDLALSELERTAPRISAAQGALDTGQAQADINRLNQFGPAAGAAMRATDASANPEFYSNLSTLGSKYGEALNALSPNLSAGQRAEIERGTARLNPYGTDNSAVSTAEKAMGFGSAHQQQIMNFANAINGISATLPNLRSGLSPINLALGRDSRSAPAAGAVTPVVKPGSTAYQIGSQNYGTLGNLTGQNQALNARTFKSYGDAFNQDSSTFANLAGGASSISGAV